MPIASLPLPARLPLKIWGGVEVHNKRNHLLAAAERPAARCAAQRGCRKSHSPDKVPVGFLLSRLDRTWAPSPHPVAYGFVAAKPTLGRPKTLLICI